MAELEQYHNPNAGHEKYLNNERGTYCEYEGSKLLSIQADPGMNTPYNSKVHKIYIGTLREGCLNF